jgi:AcrR family transcriptional regulator
MANQDKRIQAASRRRREQQKAETRQAIIEAATALFIEHGYNGFSLRGVAEQIGYSPGTIYLYFKDKDALLFQLADEGFRTFGDMLQAAVDGSERADEQLRAMGRAYLAFGFQHPVHYRLMFLERTDFMCREADSAPIGDTWLETFQILENTVKRGIAVGHLRGEHPQAVADALWAGLHGIVALGIQMDDMFDGQRIERAAQQMLLMLDGVMVSTEN